MKKFQLATFILLFMIISMFILPSFVCAEGKWKREISLGYNQASGNTDKAELSIAGSISKDFTNATLLSKFDIFYSESDGNMDSQKWLSLTRYAFDFGKRKKWFNSYQLQVDHDKFADIDYRILPAIGIGYWLSREDAWTWSAEGSFGYEMTNYKSDKSDDKTAVFIARTFLKKQILKNAFVSEDLSFIPSLGDDGVRIKSETAITNPLSDGLDLSIKYIVDYDSEPSEDKKKTDTRFIAALTYSF